jgi:hypothetical protein
MACALIALVVAGCRTLPSSPAAPPPISKANTVEELGATIAADARRSDGEPDANVRAELAAQASGAAADCLAREPQAATCLYGHAIALGLQARAHPKRASELLNAMLASLGDAEAADPTYDEAGPARVRALVLIRAPVWPLGPGDAEAGLVAARRAVALRPQYPPNLLALAEALAKAGDSNGARQNYERARALAQALPPSSDRDEWLRQAEEGVRQGGR